MGRPRSGTSIVVLLAIAVSLAACTSAPTGSPSVSPSAAETIGSPPPSTEMSGMPSATPWPAIVLSPHPVGQVVATSPLEVRSAPGTGPDSTLLAGRLFPGARFGILAGPVDASGSRWYQVESGALTGWAAARSADGEPWLASVHNGRIVFGAYAPANAGVEILSMAFDGTDVKQLATIPMADALPVPVVQPVISCGSGMTPTWSPEGIWLSFVSALACDGVIFVLKADGSGLTRLAEGQRATWAPSGATLAYDLNVPYCGGPPCGNGPWDLFTIRLPGSQSVRLTHGEEFDNATNPRWSPDGKQIAFTRWDGANVSRAFIIGSDGTGERQLSVGSVVDWLADGSGVYVSRTRADYSGEDLFLVSITGSERPVMRVPTDLSPDRNWMLTSQADPISGEFSRFLVRTDGTDSVRMPDDWWVQGWSADGLTLLISAPDPNGSYINLMAVDLSNGLSTTLHTFSGSELPSFGGFAVQPVLVTDL